LLRRAALAVGPDAANAARETRAVRWYDIRRFTCPVCGRRLAVEADPASWGAVMVCPQCNTHLRIVQRSGEAPSPTPGAGETRVVTVVLG
jgi:uncharacterized protein YbaR (Trm112 family)